MKLNKQLYLLTAVAALAISPLAASAQTTPATTTTTTDDRPRTKHHSHGWIGLAPLSPPWRY